VSQTGATSTEWIRGSRDLTYTPNSSVRSIRTNVGQRGAIAGPFPHDPASNRRAGGSCGRATKPALAHSTEVRTAAVRRAVDGERRKPPDTATLMLNPPELKVTAIAFMFVVGCGHEHPTQGDDRNRNESADDASPLDTEVEDSVAPYSGIERHLIRVAMALRGQRPSPEDLASVEQDEDALPDIVDAYLDTPEFGATIRDLHNDALLAQSDFFIYPAGFPRLPPLDDADHYAMNIAVMEAPLRLIEYVVMNDRPYSEIVTADYTVADHHVAAIWGLSEVSAADGWVVTQWEDGRSTAGILSDSWLYQRHRSTASNANRGRANALSSALLCHDFLDREVEIDATVDLSDPNVVRNAVEQNAACAACHQALDPLAGFFGDFVGVFVPAELPANGVESYPYSNFVPGYFPERFGVQLEDPAYFGQHGETLADLGTFMAADPRFSLCAARRFYAYFHQVDLDDVPLERASELQQVFIDSGMSAKAITRAIMLSDEFRAPIDDDPTAPLLKARPTQLGHLIENLTGFRWTTRLIAASESLDTGDVDLMADSFIGYRVLAGGIDSTFVTQPTYRASATDNLVLRGLALRAASVVVREDLAAEPNARRLLHRIDRNTTEESAIREQLVLLHERLLAERVSSDSDSIDESYTLFTTAFEHGDGPERAWKVVLSAMLQDLRVAHY